SNNRRIPYSVREAAQALHIGKATAARDLNVLEERGFIVVMARGAFNVKLKLATEWRLTEFNCDGTGPLPTKELARGSPKNLEHGLTTDRHGTCSETERYLRRDRDHRKQP